MKVRSKSRFSPRVSKRKIEAESNSIAAPVLEPPLKRTSKKNDKQKESSSSTTRGSTISSSVVVDKYCWICHTVTNDKICVTCHRAFHNSCSDDAPFSELGVCSECQSKSVDGTELSPNRYFNLDKLKRMLDVLTRRSFEKRRGKNEIFLGWPEEHRDKLFKIVDFEILLDNINHVPPYTKTAEFYGDVKFIYHNSCIMYGPSSDQANAAKNLTKDCETELLDLEACPECYYHLYCDESDCYDPFVRLCDPPHDIVWAQFSKYPYWPAKFLKVVKGLAHVKFFGKHEQSNVPINKCFYLSESHPKKKNSNLYNPENSGLKLQRFQSSRTELLRYICQYERKFGAFPFYPHKTPYKPQEKQNEVIITSAEGSSTRNTAQMKLEGIEDSESNEDSEANVINPATIMEISEENSPFPNNVANDITSPNGFVHESFKELSLKSLHSAGNENSRGQYSTLDELLYEYNPIPLTTAPAESGSNINQSPVTSINMSFSSDENPSNIENVPKNPVVTSIESLQSTESSIALPSAGDSSLDSDFTTVENLKGILNSAPFKVTETVNCTEILSGTVANNASNDSPIQPDALRNIMNNFSVFTGNQPELDNEVQCIGERRITEDEPINPDLVVSMLEEHIPEFKEKFSVTKYMMNAIIVNLFGNFSNREIFGRLSKINVDLRKCRDDLKKMEEENNKMKKEDTENKNQMQSLRDELMNLQAVKTNLETKLQLAEEKNLEAADNARTIIKGLKSGCLKKVEEALKKQFMGSIEEKEKKLKDAEMVIKSLEDEKWQMEKQLEEAKVAKESAEEKLKVTKSQKCVYDSDDIVIFKKQHYCRVCELSAAFVCCLNTSYCSEECQKEHAEEHRKHCRREISSQIVQQTVCQKTLVYCERSTLSNSSNSEISNTDSMAGSASSVLSTSDDRVMTSSSRSCTSKSKRRSHR